MCYSKGLTCPGFAICSYCFSIEHILDFHRATKKITKTCKKCKLHGKKIVIFNIFAQNIDCVYMLEPPPQGGSKEYLQSIFWIRNK